MQNNKRILAYEPIREIWNRYKLENNTIIRHKFSLEKIIVDESNNNQTFDFKVVSHSVVDIPETPISPIQGERVIIDISKDLDKEMNFTVELSKPQIYEIEGNTWLFITGTMHKIWSTKKTDREGKPIYHIEASATINIFKT
jgi:hypothetical protein